LPLDQEENFDNKIKELNDKVEKSFDGVLLNDWEKEITLTVDEKIIKKTVKDIIMF